jgi:hypothetical protein
MNFRAQGSSMGACRIESPTPATLVREDAPQRNHDLREVFNALRWIVRAGASWRMLPHDFPPWGNLATMCGFCRDLDETSRPLPMALGVRSQAASILARSNSKPARP